MAEPIMPSYPEHGSWSQTPLRQPSQGGLEVAGQQGWLAVQHAVDEARDQWRQFRDFGQQLRQSLEEAQRDRQAVEGRLKEAAAARSGPPAAAGQLALALSAKSPRAGGDKSPRMGIATWQAAARAASASSATSSPQQESVGAEIGELKAQVQTLRKHAATRQVEGSNALRDLQQAATRMSELQAALEVESGRTSQEALRANIAEEELGKMREVWEREQDVVHASLHEAKVRAQELEALHQAEVALGAGELERALRAEARCRCSAEGAEAELAREQQRAQEEELLASTHVHALESKLASEQQRRSEQEQERHAASMKVLLLEVAIKAQRRSNEEEVAKEREASRREQGAAEERVEKLEATLEAERRRVADELARERAQARQEESILASRCQSLEATIRKLEGDVEAKQKRGAEEFEREREQSQQEVRMADSRCQNLELRLRDLQAALDAEHRWGAEEAAQERERGQREQIEASARLRKLEDALDAQHRQGVDDMAREHERLQREQQRGAEDLARERERAREDQRAAAARAQKLEDELDSLRLGRDELARDRDRAQREAAGAAARLLELEAERSVWEQQRGQHQAARQKCQDLALRLERAEQQEHMQEVRLEKMRALEALRPHGAVDAAAALRGEKPKWQQRAGALLGVQAPLHAAARDVVHPEVVYQDSAREEILHLEALLANERQRVAEEQRQRLLAQHKVTHEERSSYALLQQVFTSIQELESQKLKQHEPVSSQELLQLGELEREKWDLEQEEGRVGKAGGPAAGEVGHAALLSAALEAQSTGSGRNASEGSSDQQLRPDQARSGSHHSRQSPGSDRGWQSNSTGGQPAPPGRASLEQSGESDATVQYLSDGQSSARVEERSRATIMARAHLQQLHGKKAVAWAMGSSEEEMGKPADLGHLPKPTEEVSDGRGAAAAAHPSVDARGRLAAARSARQRAAEGQSKSPRAAAPDPAVQNGLTPAADAAQQQQSEVSSDGDQQRGTLLSPEDSIDTGVAGTSYSTTGNQESPRRAPRSSPAKDGPRPTVRAQAHLQRFQRRKEVAWNIGSEDPGYCPKPSAEVLDDPDTGASKQSSTDSRSRLAAARSARRRAEDRSASPKAAAQGSAPPSDARQSEVGSSDGDQRPNTLLSQESSAAGGGAATSPSSAGGQPRSPGRSPRRAKAGSLASSEGQRSRASLGPSGAYKGSMASESRQSRGSLGQDPQQGVSLSEGESSAAGPGTTSFGAGRSQESLGRSPRAGMYGVPGGPRPAPPASGGGADQQHRSAVESRGGDSSGRGPATASFGNQESLGRSPRQATYGASGPPGRGSFSSDGQESRASLGQSQGADPATGSFGAGGRGVAFGKVPQQGLPRAYNGSMSSQSRQSGGSLGQDPQQGGSLSEAESAGPPRRDQEGFGARPPRAALYGGPGAQGRPLSLEGEDQRQSLDQSHGESLGQGPATGSFGTRVNHESFGRSPRQATYGAPGHPKGSFSSDGQQSRASLAQSQGESLGADPAIGSFGAGGAHEAFGDGPQQSARRPPGAYAGPPGAYKGSISSESRQSRASLDRDPQQGLSHSEGESSGPTATGAFGTRRDQESLGRPPRTAVYGVPGAQGRPLSLEGEGQEQSTGESNGESLGQGPATGSFGTGGNQESLGRSPRQAVYGRSGLQKGSFSSDGQQSRASLGQSQGESLGADPATVSFGAGGRHETFGNMPQQSTRSPPGAHKGSMSSESRQSRASLVQDRQQDVSLSEGEGAAIGSFGTAEGQESFARFPRAAMYGVQGAQRRPALLEGEDQQQSSGESHGESLGTGGNQESFGRSPRQAIYGKPGMQKGSFASDGQQSRASLGQSQGESLGTDPATVSFGAGGRHETFGNMPQQSTRSPPGAHKGSMSSESRQSRASLVQDRQQDVSLSEGEGVATGSFGTAAGQESFARFPRAAMYGVQGAHRRPALLEGEDQQQSTGESHGESLGQGPATGSFGSGGNQESFGRSPRQAIYGKPGIQKGSFSSDGQQSRASLGQSQGESLGADPATGSFGAGGKHETFGKMPQQNIRGLAGAQKGSMSSESRHSRGSLGQDGPQGVSLSEGEGVATGSFGTAGDQESLGRFPRVVGYGVPGQQRPLPSEPPSFEAPPPGAQRGGLSGPGAAAPAPGRGAGGLRRRGSQSSEGTGATEESDLLSF